MIEVFDNIFVGSDDDYEAKARDYNFSYLHCAKYPYHKKIVGYTESISPTHPEYFFAHRNGIVSLNMVDSQEAKHFNVIQFQYAILFIQSEIKKGQKVLINCNKGQSRSPSIAMVYLARLGVVSDESFAQAKEDFIKIYPDYKPAFGITKFMVFSWRLLMQTIVTQK